MQYFKNIYSRDPATLESTLARDVPNDQFDIYSNAQVMEGYEEMQEAGLLEPFDTNVSTGPIAKYPDLAEARIDSKVFNVAKAAQTFEGIPISSLSPSEQLQFNIGYELVPFAVWKFDYDCFKRTYAVEIK